MLIKHVNHFVPRPIVLFAMFAVSVGATDSSRALAQVRGGQVTGGIEGCEVLDIEVAPPNGVETPEERVQRLERALQASLSAYDECQTALSSSSSGSASAAGAGTSTASGSAQGTESQNSDSTDSRDSDDERTAKAEANGEQERDRDNIDVSDMVSGRPNDAGDRLPSVELDNGAIPEDIPPGNDDDIVAQQIREAAIKESDPAVKERLWADYRKYKGLPPQ